MAKLAFFGLLCTLAFGSKATAQLYLPPNSLQRPSVKSFSRLPQNFYTRHLGYFCKKEDQLQKATGLPVFFRLGSKSLVDYYEQKPNATKPF